MTTTATPTPETKTTIATGAEAWLYGTVERIDPDLGYGFLRHELGDVFFAASALGSGCERGESDASGEDLLQPGTPVRFRALRGRTGIRATLVETIEAVSHPVPSRRRPRVKRTKVGG